ncbi:hypothetical protein CARUB_v10020718mg [Capsella rubella]|uniref:Uncharacterized protein n=2 Tax=Capsella rubella TaxID=81985 RepID=R0GII1_9BRAS|nr:hypothetical protein CARUB_v10020718mg [Capsella rubella]
MLWTGEPPQAEALKEAMESYFNALQGFLLHCHGSMAGAGTTLFSSIQASVKQIVGTSFRLLQGSVSLYEGEYEKGRKPSIPQLAGAVWEACSNLKKVPATNIKAIGKAMTQVTVSMKDVLREMKELKPACFSPEPDDAYANPETETPNSDEDDLGDDLTPAEFEVSEMVADIVSEALVVIKELIRAITGMIKLENPKDDGAFVATLENLLKLCQDFGVQIDELGACVYPPQELSLMKQTLGRIRENIGEIEADVKGFKNSSSGALLGTCRRLQSSIENMETELDKRVDAEVVGKMQNVTL